MYLDLLPFEVESIGHGAVGLNGHLGYSNFRTCIMGRHYEHAVSAHGPSTLIFKLDGKFESFRTQVGLNDLPSSHASADFFIYADGNLVACALGVRNNQSPRTLTANLYKAQTLVLKVICADSSFCFSSWLDPTISTVRIGNIQGPIGGLSINLPEDNSHSSLCIVTAVTPNFVHMTADMLGSLFHNGGVRGAKLVLMSFETDANIRRLAERHNALIVECASEPGANGILQKSAVYSIARVVSADKYLIIDSDTAVLGGLNAPIKALDTIPQHHILIARDQGTSKDMMLKTAMFGGNDIYPYFSDPGDALLIPLDENTGSTKMVVNTGVVFGRKCAFLAIDEMMRTLMPGSATWENKKEGVTWREQGVFNAACAILGNLHELDSCYNTQTLTSKVSMAGGMESTTASCDGAPINVIHFNGQQGKQFYETMWRGRYLHIQAPIFGRNDAEPFGRFLGVLEETGKRFDRLTRVRLGIPLTTQITDYAEIFKGLAKIRLPNEPKVLIIDSKAGISAAYIAVGGCGNVASLDVLAQKGEEGESNTLVFRSLPQDAQQMTLREGDVSSVLRAISDSKERYDLVILETFNSTKKAYTNLLMAMDVLSKNGALVLHDFAYPGCDLSQITSKAEASGYSVDAISITPYGPSLLRVSK